jgi:hypothetical protein
VQHALQEIQKVILFVRTDRNNLPFPASIGPRFIGSLNLSIYRLRKIWFGIAAMAPARHRQASLPLKQPSIRQRSAKTRGQTNAA